MYCIILLPNSGNADIIENDNLRNKLKYFAANLQIQIERDKSNLSNWQIGKRNYLLNKHLIRVC